MESITKRNDTDINSGKRRFMEKRRGKNFGCVLEKSRGRCYNVESKVVKNDEKSN